MAKGKNGCGVPIADTLSGPEDAQSELERLGVPPRSPSRSAEVPEDERQERRRRINAQVEELEGYIQEAVDNPQLVSDWISDLARSDLWRYSYGNLCLARAQAKSRDLELTRLAGFKRWQALGYQVRRGEKGLMMIAPKSYVRKNPETGEPLLDKQGNKLRGHYFGTVSVFDISQADPRLDHDGRPINLDLNSTPSSDQAVAELSRVAQDQGFEVLLDGAPQAHPDSQALNQALLANPQSDGFFRGTDQGGVIVLRPGLGSERQARALAHELSGALMRSARPGYKEHEDPARREAEAESAAFVIASHYGLESSDQALYVANWLSTLDEQVGGELTDQGLSGRQLEREIAERKRWMVRDALANIQGTVKIVLDRAYDVRSAHE